ncbi:S-adenosyl-L-methionine-dependent methyltransferase [Lichtheimia hyalospora FSU 10163]|nr:S-adenosyl-L-methionine-dependent methyltransferase [Lichtheimia hyalospora FSU 10163]
MHDEQDPFIANDNDCTVATATTKQFNLDRLPASFQQFLVDNAIDPGIYTVSDLPRYVRLNTNANTLPSLDDLKEQLGTSNVWQVKDGIFGFLHAKHRLVDIAAYKNRSLFGIDLSSAMAVEALDLQANDQVLDMCCAPGAKLCMIANRIEASGSATGVDCAAHRLATCRSLLKKYKVGSHVRLFEADGTTFAIPPPLAPKERQKKHTLDVNHRKPYWAPKMLRFDPQTSTALYDKVLVDAECTHDGSISHILKYEKWGWDAFERNFMNPDRLSTVCELQRNLMKQGWKMLKHNGIMVYSTCSLTVQQNEANVAWFLKHHPDAVLENADNADIKIANIKKVEGIDNTIQQAMERHCLRFDPLISQTSGFFLARLRKH